MPLTLPATVLSDKLIEDVIRSTMQNFPEASSSSLACIRFRYPDDKPLSEWRFTFEEYDDEEPKLHKISEAELKKAFELMTTTDVWSKCKGLQQPPRTDTWDDWDRWLCNCDCTDHDAFAQLACLGEIIYG